MTPFDINSNKIDCKNNLSINETIDINPTQKQDEKLTVMVSSCL